MSRMRYQDALGLVDIDVIRTLDKEVHVEFDSEKKSKFWALLYKHGCSAVASDEFVKILDQVRIEVTDALGTKHKTAQKTIKTLAKNIAWKRMVAKYMPIFETRTRQLRSAQTKCDSAVQRQTQLAEKMGDLRNQLKKLEAENKQLLARLEMSVSGKIVEDSLLSKTLDPILPPIIAWVQANLHRMPDASHPESWTIKPDEAPDTSHWNMLFNAAMDRRGWNQRIMAEYINAEKKQAESARITSLRKALKDAEQHAAKKQEQIDQLEERLNQMEAHQKEMEAQRKAIVADSVLDDLDEMKGSGS